LFDLNTGTKLYFSNYCRIFEFLFFSYHVLFYAFSRLVRIPREVEG